MRDCLSSRKPSQVSENTLRRLTHSLESHEPRDRKDESVGSLPPLTQCPLAMTSWFLSFVYIGDIDCQVQWPIVNLCHTLSAALDRVDHSFNLKKLSSPGLDTRSSG